MSGGSLGYSPSVLIQQSTGPEDTQALRKHEDLVVCQDSWSVVLTVHFEATHLTSLDHPSFSPSAIM